MRLPRFYGAACILVSGLAGVALVPAFSPLDIWPLAAIAPVPLCWIASRPGLPRTIVVLAGLSFGIAFFAGSISWIVSVMHRFGGLSAPAAAGVLLLLVAYLAAFPAAFAAGLHRIARRLGPVAALAAAPALWVALELARNHVLTGFPWVRLGTAAHSTPALLQLVSVTGVYGVSALLIGVAAATAGLLAARSRAAMAYAGLVALAAIGSAAWGAHRAGETTPGSELRVACIQGNIPQDRKWDPEAAQRILDRHVRLTAEAAEAGARLIVWSESSMPYALRAHPSFGAAVRELAARLKVWLVIGSLDRRDGAGGERAVFNSAFLLGPGGEIEGVYDKVHLVPFGEYVPWRRALSFAESLVEEVGELRPGDGIVLLGGKDGLPALGVMICYEIIFPQLPRRAVRDGAEVLLNLTNDAWFGATSAPHQHFAEAVVRAVETGRYVVRAANTGISGIIDPRGRVLARSRLGETTVVVADVQARGERTVYTRVGDSFAWACVILATVALILPGPRFPALRSLSRTRLPGQPQLSDRNHRPRRHDRGGDAPPNQEARS